MLHIGETLRDKRKRSMLTQQQLAEKAGVGIATIVRLERNQAEPQGRTLSKLAQALEIDPKELLEH